VPTASSPVWAVTSSELRRQLFKIAAERFDLGAAGLA